jgi:hypothetical protein
LDGPALRTRTATCWGLWTGDAAAVPDLIRPERARPMTAKHAQRHGQRAFTTSPPRAAGRRRPYRHHDLGFIMEPRWRAGRGEPDWAAPHRPAGQAVTPRDHLLALPDDSHPHRRRLAASASSCLAAPDPGPLVRESPVAWYFAGPPAGGYGDGERHIPCEARPTLLPCQRGASG